MTDELTDDQQRLLEQLPMDGTTIGNKALRERLAWDEDRYWRERNPLVDAGLVEKGKGKGGSIKLVLAPEVIEATPEGAEEAAAEVAELYAEEAALYPPVREVIKNGWAKNRNIKPDVVEITARQGKTPTGGPWTRPDVVSVAVQQFTHLPGKFIEVVTFEIKPSNNITVLAVYEALAHRRSATHAYVILHVPPDDESRLAEDIDRVLTAARARHRRDHRWRSG